MSELFARAYLPDDRAAWDAHVRASRIPHPMLERGWVEYHADRFVDASLVVVRADGAGGIVAVIPASAHGTEVVTHGGLSFGGVVTTRKVGAARMLDVFDAIRTAYAAAGFTNLRYKAVPHVFHGEPAEEDLYALVRCGARLARRDISAAIDLRLPLRSSERRRRSLKQADASIELRPSTDWDAFIAMQTVVLDRHGVRPVHTGGDLALLHERFPDDVRLLAAFDGSQLVGGTLVVTTPTVAHTQYIGGLPSAQAAGVVDRLLDDVIREQAAAGRRWLSFGINTERDGAYLNTGLAEYKESFGARGIVHDHYDLPLGGTP